MADPPVVVKSRRRGLVYPYELSAVLAGPGGTLVEHDLDDDNVLVPVERPYGLNTSGILTAVVSTPTGMIRPAGARRTRRSAATRRMAPVKAAGIIARPGCPPERRRARKGATKPTNPIAPHTEVAAPTAIALSTTTSSEIRFAG